MAKYNIICCASLFLSLLVLTNNPTVTGHPIGKVNDINLEKKNEIHYPNGTVVGKYSYTDYEGNPISVKYYADKTSYGVELNSFKIIEPASNFSLQTKSNASIDSMTHMDPLLDLASDILAFSKDKGSNKMHLNTLKTNEKEKSGHHSEHPKTKLNSPDYETFYQNEVKAPKQCEKDKVKVYLVKEKRKTRAVLFNDNKYASNYCQQY